MALRWIDGFDGYSVNGTNLSRRYTLTSTSGWASSTGRTGSGNSLSISTANNFQFTKVLDNQSSWVVGFAFQINTLPTGSTTQEVLRVLSDTTTHMVFNVNPAGQIRWENGSTTLLGSSSSTLVAGQWNYIEIKFTVADSVASNSCVLRVNGSAWITLSAGTDTKNGSVASANLFRWTCSGANVLRYDDIYICDGTGSANNDFLGDCKVLAVLPSGAGANTGLTPSAGSNYQCVDDTDPNDDTDYVAGATGTDTYAFADIATGYTVKGVQVNVVARKDLVGDTRSVTPVARVGSTNYSGAATSLGIAYANCPAVFETNPSTGTAWTAAQVNSSEFGVTAS